MQFSTAHSCESCVAPFCDDPEHFLLDVDVDLDYLISLALHQQRFDQLLPETAWAHAPVAL